MIGAREKTKKKNHRKEIKTVSLIHGKLYLFFLLDFCRGLILLYPPQMKQKTHKGRWL